jgi:hypothetical protein
VEGKSWSLQCILGCIMSEKDEREMVIKMRERERE